MRTLFYVILTILVLLSLALNGVVLAGLWTARQATIEALDQTLASLDSLGQETFEMTFRVQETVPVNAKVPFRRDLVVPVSLDVPIQDEIAIQETLEVPINTPLLDFTVDVPISTAIPINLMVPVDGQVPIAISETIPVNTEVAIDLTVPIAIDLADTPLPSYLEQLRATLEQVRDQLSFGME